MIRLGLIAAVSVGIAVHLAALADGARFPLFTCSEDYQNGTEFARIDCKRPHEIVDALQKQLDALEQLRAGWDGETSCGGQYRKAREWLDSDRASLLRNAQNLLNECNRAGMSYIKKLSMK